MTVGLAAFEEVIHPIPGLVAGGDMNTDAYQYHFVKISADEAIALAGNNEMPIGVLCNKPLSGGGATVAGPASTIKLKAGGSISAGNQLCPKSDGSGEAVASTTGDPSIAVALVGGADHDLITAYIVGGLTLHA